MIIIKFKDSHENLMMKFNDGHENLMMIMKTATRIMIFKGTRDALNDGPENLMMIMRTLNDGHEFS
mgnify:CR=1 FL=1